MTLQVEGGLRTATASMHQRKRLTGMFSLELLQQLHLLLLVAARATHLLLSLVIHHFLDHGTSLAIQITQAGILWRDLGYIDLGCSRHDMRPPFDLVDLIEVDVDFLSGRSGGSLQGPGGFIDSDSVREITLETTENRLALLGNAKGTLTDMM